MVENARHLAFGFDANMTAKRAALVANLTSSGGAERRSESMVDLLSLLGYTVEVLTPKFDRRRPPTIAELRLLATGRIVPEALLWNTGAVADQIRTIGPDVTVLQTSRAVHPAVLDAAVSRAERGRRPVVVLDLVDQLSTSYRQRAAVSGPLMSTTFRLLAVGQHRFEAGLQHFDGPLLAAGRTEADAIGVNWIPITITEPFSRPKTAFDERPHDAVFFGTLSYQPNVEALRQLDEWLRTTRRQFSILVAGRGPTIRG